VSIKVHTRRLDEQHVIVTESELQSLIAVARQVSPVELEEATDELPIEGLMQLAESSGALDFLWDEREDVYSVEDLKVRYR
jgi:hypothetical protein